MPNHTFTTTNALNISLKQVKPPHQRPGIAQKLRCRENPQCDKAAKILDNGARRKSRNASSVPKRKRRVLGILPIRPIVATQKTPTTVTQDSILWLMEGNTQSQALVSGAKNSGEVTTSSPDPLPPPLALPTFYAVNKETIWAMGGGVINDSESSWDEEETIIDVEKGQERVDALENIDTTQTIDRVDRRQCESWVMAPAFKNFPVNSRLARRGTLLAPETRVVRTRSWAVANKQGVLPAKRDVAEDIIDTLSSPEICSALEKEEEGRVLSARALEALPTFTGKVVLDGNCAQMTTLMRNSKNQSQMIPIIPPVVPMASDTDNLLNDNLVLCPSSQPPSFNLRSRSRLLSTITSPLATSDVDGLPSTFFTNGVVRNPLLRRMLRM